MVLGLGVCEIYEIYLKGVNEREYGCMIILDWLAYRNECDVIWYRCMTGKS